MSKNQLVLQGFLFLHGKKLYKYAMSLTVLVASIPFLREKGNYICTLTFKLLKLLCVLHFMTRKGLMLYHKEDDSSI